MAKKPRIIEPIPDTFDNVVQSIFNQAKEPERPEMTIDDRIHEKDLFIPTLRIANSRPGGFIETSDLIVELEAVFNVAGEDAEILPDRSDTKFSQKVRNMVSHRKSPSSFISNGFAEYDDDKSGIQITVLGRKLLESLGD